jgi:putative endonuclease
MRGGWVYILASRSGVLYTGVASHLDRRFMQHLLKRSDGFTKKYNVTRLVYVEKFGDIRNAIAREKQIKRWVRKKKIALIEKTNRYWRDLAEEMFPPPPNDD